MTESVKLDELDQYLSSDKSPEDCMMLSDLDGLQIVTAYPNGETSFNRIVAKCFLPDGRDLAAEIVKMELAIDIPHFTDADYKNLETPNSRRKLRWRPKKKE